MSLLEGDLPTPAGVWASLARGVVDRRSPFGRPAIATVDPLGQAEVRTVVLRDVQPGARQLVLHSDTRAAKVAALAHHPRLAWHFWDPRPRLQLRASGPATVHTRGPMVDETWARLSVHQQRTYAAEPAPGHPSGCGRRRAAVGRCGGGGSRPLLCDHLHDRRLRHPPAAAGRPPAVRAVLGRHRLGGHLGGALSPCRALSPRAPRPGAARRGW